MLKWLAVIFVLFALAGVAGFTLKPWEKFRAKPPEWKTEKVDRGDILITVTATGTVNPVRTVLIGAQVSGKVKDVYKYSNDVVKKGEVLAELETDLLEAERRSAEVRLKQVRAGLKLLQVERDNLTLRETRHTSTIERKKISVERARGSLDLAAKNLSRYQDLLKVDATSRTELDILAL